MSKKWVYLFEEVAEAEKYAGDWEGVRSLLGGKGAGLADMTRAGVPVPPGFTVTTEACNAYRKAGKFPEGQWEQELEAMKAVEKKTGKKFGDPSNPLLGFLPFRREVLHARHDEYGPEHRFERCHSRRNGQADRQSTLCVRLLSPPGRDVRHSGDGY